MAVSSSGRQRVRSLFIDSENTCGVLRAVDDVLNNQDLICYILRFLVPAEGLCLRERCRISTVCRAWRHAVIQGVPAALHLGSTVKVEHIQAILENSRVLSNIRTITIERDSARIADRQLLQVLRTCASHGLSRHSLQKLSGVFIYAPALAQVAESFPNLTELSCSSNWSADDCGAWLPPQLQDLDITLNSRYRMSALSEQRCNGRAFESCASLRKLTLRGFSKVSLTQMPPSLEHLHFFERRDVSHGESLQLRLGGACLRRISVVLPGLRRRDEQGKKRLARAKITPADHWHFAEELEYVGVEGQLFEVQSPNLLIGWDIPPPDQAACQQAAASFLSGFLASRARSIIFRTAALQLVVSVKLQNDAFNPYIGYGLSAADLSYYINKEYKGRLVCQCSRNSVTLAKCPR